MEPRIGGLFIYPVKGCAPLALRQARLSQRGLAHDRRWMLVDPAGDAVTQREIPGLATVRPRIDGEVLTLQLDDIEVAVPIADVGETVRVTVWGDVVEAVAPDAVADAALTAALGRPVRLVRFPEATLRPCDPSYAPPGSHTGFADGFPLLVTSEGSLAALNERLADAGAEPVSMARFRPNLVLDGVPAGAEDRAGRLATGGIELRLVKRCDRCVVTTIDQATGTKTGKEPLATLARIRRNVATGGAWFGQNAVPMLSTGEAVTLEVGQACALGGE